MMRWLIWMSLFFGLWGGSASSAYAQEDDSLLKAAFIYQFSKFVYWSNNVKPNPLILCTLGEDKLIEVINGLDADIIPNKKVIVQSVQAKIGINNCHILYIASSEHGSFRSLDVISQRKAILTISELPGFVEAGGIIELIYEGNKIRFDINNDAARHKGLEISSSLLKLARKVKWENRQ